jgi:hypothetical protein
MWKMEIKSYNDKCLDVNFSCGSDEALKWGGYNQPPHRPLT